MEETSLRQGRDAFSRWGILLLIWAIVLGEASLPRPSGGSTPWLLLFTVLGLTGVTGLSAVKPSFLERMARWIYVIPVSLGFWTILYSPTVRGVTVYTQFILMLYPVAFALVLCNKHGTGLNGFVTSLIAAAFPIGVAVLSGSWASLVAIVVTEWAVLKLAVLKNWFEVKPATQRNLLWGMLAGIFVLAVLFCIFGGGTFLNEVLAEGTSSPYYAEGLGNLVGWNAASLLLNGGRVIVLLWSVAAVASLNSTPGQLTGMAFLLTVGFQVLFRFAAVLGAPLFYAHSPQMAYCIDKVITLCLWGVFLSVLQRKNDSTPVEGWEPKGALARFIYSCEKEDA